MKNYIYIHKYSLSNELCKDIIEKFEANRHLCYKGNTSKGVDIKVKDSLDLNILKLNEWNKINDFLSKELTKHLTIYHQKCNKISHDYQVNTFQIQKYDKGCGKFVTHTDNLSCFKLSREIVFMWYLNDVDNGGETGFPECNINIKPEVGKLVLFPATWTYPHCGNVPLSSHKYIITGWVNKIHTE
jgi:hypothetical protein